MIVRKESFERHGIKYREFHKVRHISFVIRLTFILHHGLKQH